MSLSWLLLWRVSLALLLCCGRTCILLSAAQRSPVEVSGLCQTPTSQVNALKALYTYTQGWQWTWKSHTEGIEWSFDSTPKSDPCQDDWQGVFCDAKTCDVLQLVLFDFNLHGPLPSAISDLSFLVRLDLSANRLNGSIPHSITSLHSLQSLELVENDFTGSIPNNIGDLQNLQYFTVNRNKFLTGTIPASFGDIPNLKGLEITSYFVNGSLPSSLCALQNLTELMVVYTNISGTIPTCLSNITKLASVKLYHNKLTGTFPADLCDVEFLFELDVGTNRLHGTLPDCFQQNVFLKYFSVYENFFTGSLPRSLGNVTHLAYLSADTNFFQGSIPPEYGQLHELTRFNVFLNLLTGSLPSGIGNNPAMYDFLVYFNHLEGSLPASVSQLTAMQSFDCHHNFFVGTVPDLPSSDLNFLVLQNNMFTGKAPVLGNAVLVLFNLSSNYFTGSIRYDALNYSLLHYVDISFNDFTGSIPYALATAKNLLELRICHNSLTGQVVLDSSQQTQLKNLDFSNNLISGVLPMEIFQLPALQTVAAVRNCIKGSLPENICNGSKALLALALDGLHTADQCRDRIFSTPPLSSIPTYKMNHAIKGTIPACLFSVYPSLQGLHLSGNGIAGSLPSSLSFISPSLTDLQLSNNRLTGTIPLIIQRHNWTNLDLSFNMLYGTITDDLFSHIAVSSSGNNGTDNSEDDSVLSFSLSLQINHLSGQVPNSIKSLETVNVLDGNLFSCHADRSDLPRHDPEYNYYDCGSSNTTFAIIVWIAMAAASVLGLLLVQRCVGHASPSNPFEQWLAYYIASQELLEDAAPASTLTSPSISTETPSMPRMSTTLVRSTTIFMSGVTMLAQPVERAFMTMPEMRGSEANIAKAQQRQVYKRFFKFLQRFRYQLLFMMLYALLILLPAYAALSAGYGTYQFKYIWSTSMALLSGLPPAVVLLFLLLVGMFAVRILYFFARRQYTNYRQEIIDEEKALHGSQPENIPILMLMLLVNLIAVLATNIAFVYSASGNFTSDEKSFISIGLSMFKICWNVLLFQLMHRLVHFRSRVLYGGYVMTLDGVMKWTAILNSVIIPIVAVAMASPNCFLYTWTTPSDVEVSYTTQQCVLLYTSANELPYCYPTPTTDSFSPAFQYSFQCTSNVMENFMNVFIYRFIFQSLVFPALWLLWKYLHQHTPRDSFAFRVVHPVYMVLLPPLLRVDINQEVDLDLPASKYFTLLNQKLFSIELKVDFAIILVFGWLFPPLAIIGCLSSIARTYFVQVSVGRLLHGASQHASLQVYVDQVEQEMKSFLVASNYMPSSFMILAGIEWALFMFDMVGNAEGWRAGMATFFGFLGGLFIVGTLEYIWKRRFVKGAAKKIKTKEAAGKDSGEQIELNEEVSFSAKKSIARFEKDSESVLNARDSIIDHNKNDGREEVSNPILNNRINTVAQL